MTDPEYLSLKDRFQKLDSLKDDLMKENSALANKNLDLETEISKLRSQNTAVNGINASLDTTKKDLAEMNKELNSTKEELEKTKDDLMKKDEELAKSKKKFDSLDCKFLKLKSSASMIQFQDVSRKLAESKEKCAHLEGDVAVLQKKLNKDTSTAAWQGQVEALQTELKLMKDKLELTAGELEKQKEIARNSAKDYRGLVVANGKSFEEKNCFEVLFSDFI